MGLISPGSRLRVSVHLPTGGKAKQQDWRQLPPQRGTSSSYSRGLHRVLQTPDRGRGAGGCKSAPLGLRFPRSKPKHQCVYSLRLQETYRPTQLWSEAKVTVKRSLQGSFLLWRRQELHIPIKMHWFLFRGPNPNHPGGLWLDGGIGTLPDSPKDVWPRLGCVIPMLASGGLETGAASQRLYKLSLQWSCRGVLHVASKPPISLAFLRITGIGCQSFPWKSGKLSPLNCPPAV